MMFRAVALAAFSAVALSAPASAQAPAPASATPAKAPATICGRPADVSQLLLSMQKPSVENVFRDKMIFVLRDADDNSVWAFSIKHTTVHPAARCQRTVKAGGTSKPEIEQICGASEKACASFASQADERFRTFAQSTPPAVPTTAPAKVAN